MITTDTQTFFDFAKQIKPNIEAAVPKAIFLVCPDGFALAQESASDNLYMATAEQFDAEHALKQHHAMHLAMAKHTTCVAFSGHPNTPDAVFPNNVFATSGTNGGRVVVARMHHPVRQKEAERQDMRRFFTQTLGYEAVDLSTQHEPCELTGSLVIDRARNIGYCGLSERCSAEGARLMHDAFGLDATLLFDLTPQEYHTNVVLAVLAGRTAVVCPQGFVDEHIAQAIADFYDQSLICDEYEHQNFVGNCIAITPDTAWMSARAGHALSDAHRQKLNDAGFTLHTPELHAIEAGGGSLRCCIGEIY